jgi:hypothetical protein
MASSDLYAVIVEELSAERAEVVQALLEEKGNGWWWHNLPNVWIVGGGSTAFWRDAIRPVVAGTDAKVLVLRLPREKGDRWASFGGGEKKPFKWLHEAFAALDRSHEG